MTQAKAWLLGTLSAALVLGCGKKAEAPPMAAGTKVDGGSGVVDLDQGWSHADQDGASFASFGSRLIPKQWLQHLEVAGGKELFISDANMAALGFLVQTPTKVNPAGFPVGFTVHADKQGREWAGLGCAACHTGQIDYQGTRMRIDGGQALIDFDEFEGDLLESLSATAAQDDKFGRFADALKTKAADRQGLRNDLVAAAQKLDARHRLNDSPVRYGPGRLDAFGQIFNAVAVDFLGIPSNLRVPDAPVSYPVMWDASHLDLVQWNGSAPNAGPGPLIQNVTTALAVYGSLDVKGRDELAGFPSSVDFKHLAQIQNWFYKLRAPRWPEAVLGKLDGAKLARGASIYGAQCQSCHALSDRGNPKRQLKSTLTPLGVVGTDPKMVRNFLDAKVSTGPWQGRKVAVVAGEKFGAQAQSIELVAHAAIGATLRHPLSQLAHGIQGRHRQASGLLQGAAAVRHLGQRSVPAQRLGALAVGTAQAAVGARCQLPRRRPRTGSGAGWPVHRRRTAYDAVRHHAAGQWQRRPRIRHHAVRRRQGRPARIPQVSVTSTHARNFRRRRARPRIRQPAPRPGATARASRRARAARGHGRPRLRPSTAVRRAAPPRAGPVRGTGAWSRRNALRSRRSACSSSSHPRNWGASYRPRFAKG
jgi:mono/diheme cytochrome c family protein